MAGLERLRAGMEDWRARKRRGERIPAVIWRSAVEESKRHGTSCVCRILKLGYADLKRRAAAVEQAGRLEGRPAFKELSDAPLRMGMGCVVELAKPNGVRLRVSVPVQAGVDWSQLKAAFLEA